MPAPEHFINNTISSHQYLTHSHQPKYVWTVENDPIYEDITEVKRKIVSKSEHETKAKQDKSVQKTEKTLTPSPSTSTVQYGVITAKEVAKFVPCTDINIGR